MEREREKRWGKRRGWLAAWVGAKRLQSRVRGKGRRTTCVEKSGETGACDRDGEEPKGWRQGTKRRQARDGCAMQGTGKARAAASGTRERFVRKTSSGRRRITLRRSGIGVVSPAAPMPVSRASRESGRPARSGRSVRGGRSRRSRGGRSRGVSPGRATGHGRGRGSGRRAAAPPRAQARTDGGSAATANCGRPASLSRPRVSSRDRLAILANPSRGPHAILVSPSRYRRFHLSGPASPRPSRATSGHPWRRRRRRRGTASAPRPAPGDPPHRLWKGGKAHPSRPSSRRCA